MSDSFILKVVHSDGYTRNFLQNNARLKSLKEAALRAYTRLRAENTFRAMTTGYIIVTSDGVVAAKWKPPLIDGRMVWKNYNGYGDQDKAGLPRASRGANKPKPEFKERSPKMKLDSYNAQMIEVLQECMRHARAMGLDQNWVFWAWDDFYNKSLVINFNHPVDQLTNRLLNHKIPGVDYIVNRGVDEAKDPFNLFSELHHSGVSYSAG